METWIMIPVYNWPLAASIAPVMAPLPIEFQGSSLSLTAISAQSSVEYRPPQTAKFPRETTNYTRSV